MQLENPFKQQTRLLFLYCYSCFKCGRSDRGLELHHVTGRDSSSAFNACPLCKDCHDKIGHFEEEEKELTGYVLKFLASENYRPTDEDYEHLIKHERLIKDNDIIKQWLNQN